MEVTLKNREIDQGLVLVREFVKKSLPVKLSFAVAKTMRNSKRRTSTAMRSFSLY